MRDPGSVAAAIFVMVLGACSNPDNNKPVIVDDEDMGSTLDVNNSTPDVNIDEGCQVSGCPDSQVCNMQTGICVDCLTNAECGENGSCDPVSNKCSCADGFHLCDGACVSNDSVDSCGASCTPCPTDPNGVAGCDGTQCTLTCNGELVQDPASGACVGCTSNADCAGPAASVCGGTGACEPCAAAADCAHIVGRPICDAGLCAQCSSADDSACNGNSCDPFDGTCTTTPKASVGACEPCVADSECDAGHACVPMEFQGDLRAGGFCLPVDAGDCAAPYPVSVTRTSLSGVAGDYCTLNELLTTCEAVADYFADCADASDCGVDGFDDGFCEPVDFEFSKCTIPCDDSAECPSASLIGCATGDGTRKWCGAF